MLKSSSLASEANVNFAWVACFLNAYHLHVRRSLNVRAVSIICFDIMLTRPKFSVPFARNVCISHPIGQIRHPKMSSLLQKMIFVASLCFASCCYGMVSAQRNVFPFTIWKDASSAATAYMEVYFGEQKMIDPDLSAPTVRRSIVRGQEQLFLVAGGEDYQASESSTGHTLAWIMNREGQVRHVWEYDPQIWSQLEQVKAAPLNSEVFPVGLHLFEDGSLLANFQGKNCWPYGVGLAKFDKDSNLLWKKEQLNHHWFTVAEDGRIYTATMRIVESPLQLGNSQAAIISDDGKITDDVILILDAEGNVLEEISLLQAFVDSGWIGLFQGATDDNIHAHTGDPTHLNDVRVVSAETAAAHELLNEGDMLVSVRSLNAIGILDGKTKLFKWLCAGAALRQHSPRIVEDGILLLDNRGGSPATGGSRLIKIDFDSRQPTTVFPPAEVESYEFPFSTTVAGHLDLKGERVLVSLTDRAEIWEVDLATGQVLWEYVYVDAEDRERRPIYTSKYVGQPTFEFNRNEEQAQ